LGKKINLCNEIIDLENASLDHKIPRTGSKVTKRNKGRQAYTYEEIRKLDDASNLQIICRKCNNYKGEFNSEEYNILLNFLNINTTIKEKLFKRFRTGMLFFKYK
jgi:hypothetical protein